VPVPFVSSGRFVCSACRFALTAVIYRILFFRMCILSRRYFPFSPRLNRGVSRTKIEQTADEMSLHSKLKVIVEIKLKGKQWGNPLEDQNMYSLGEKNG